MPALADKGIPTILTGFALPESNVHSPNERMLVDYIREGSRRSRSCTPALATSPRAEFATALAAELADDVLDRFLRYVRIDTQSAHGSTTSPSTEKQLDSRGCCGTSSSRSASTTCVWRRAGTSTARSRAPRSASAIG